MSYWEEHLSDPVEVKDYFDGRYPEWLVAGVEGKDQARRPEVVRLLSEVLPQHFDRIVVRPLRVDSPDIWLAVFLPMEQVEDYAKHKVQEMVREMKENNSREAIAMLQDSYYEYRNRSLLTSTCLRDMLLGLLEADKEVKDARDTDDLFSQM